MRKKADHKTECEQVLNNQDNYYSILPTETGHIIVISYILR